MMVTFFLKIAACYFHKTLVSDRSSSSEKVTCHNGDGSEQKQLSITQRQLSEGRLSVARYQSLIYERNAQVTFDVRLIAFENLCTNCERFSVTSNDRVRNLLKLKQRGKKLIYLINSTLNSIRRFSSLNLCVCFTVLFFAAGCDSFFIFFFSQRKD